ncbi:MAG: response regulator [Opitutaceae bacterium]
MTPFSTLVVDDEQTICTLLQRWLTEAGWTAVTASSGLDACVMMKRQPFDLVITDVLMPDGDGLDLINELKKVQPEARILAMSGGGRYIEGDDYLKLARGIGAHAAVMKPFDRKQLQAAIDLALVAEPARAW